MTCLHSSTVLHQHATSRPPAQQLQWYRGVRQRLPADKQLTVCLAQLSTHVRGLPSCSGSKRRCTAKARAQNQNSNGSNSSEGSGQEQQADTQHEASLQEVAQQCFEDSPDTKARLQRVGSAAAQVAALQAAQADLAKQMREATQLSPQDNRRLEQEQAQAASERGSQADIVHAAEQLQAATSELMAAEAEKAKWQSSINEAAEKAESAKAAGIAGLAGGLASLPYTLAAGQPPLSTALSVAACLASCTLFGVTFRYAVRQDLQNLQLKSGVVAAFGLVRGGAQADMLQLSASNPLSADTSAQAALVAGESMLTFGFAAVALELAFRSGQLKPFGFSTSQADV